MEKLLITGAGGFVGGNIVVQALGFLPEDWEIHAVSGKPAPMKAERLRWETVDVLDERELKENFNRIRPSAVIHSAAIANIDFCEANPETARTVNVELTRRIVSLCESSGAKLVFVSTDTIFDGERGNYTEEDVPGTINTYAETKVEAERFVRELKTPWAIGRICLVTGYAVFGKGNTFLPKMVSDLAEGKKVEVTSLEVRSPIDVITAARALIELATSDLQGVFHLAGNDIFPRTEMARRIAKHLGYSPDLIVPQDPNATTGRAPRPRDVSLDNGKARRELRTPMLDLEDALDRIVEARGRG